MRAPTVLALAALALVACRVPAASRYEASVEAAPAPAAHAVHEQRLAALMRGLEQLRDGRLPKALDPLEEERRQARELARVADAMASSAVWIARAPPADLDAEQRADFEALARRLEVQCANLGDDAVGLDDAGRRQRVSEIDSTCDACHVRFRIPRRSRADD